MTSADLTDIYKQGYGEAYILPVGEAVETYLKGLDRNLALRRQLLENERIKQQKFDETINKKIGQITPGEYRAKFAPEIQKQFEDVIEKAKLLKIQGMDPFADKGFLTEYEKLKSNARATGEWGKSYDAFIGQASKNPDAYDNVSDLMKQYQDVKFEDIVKGGFVPGELRKRYSMADAIKESGGVISYVKNNDGVFDTVRVNRHGNIGQGISSLSTKAAQYRLSNIYGGDVGPYIEGFPTVKPDGKVYYNTKGKDFEKAVISKLAADANFPVYLQQKGYQIDSPQSIRAAAMDYAQKQNKAVGKYVSDYADVLEKQATTDTTRVFTAENMRLARERFNYNKGKTEKQPANIIEKVVTNVAGELGGKQGMLPSTSKAAVNLGNGKHPLLPTEYWDTDTGQHHKNSSPMTVTEAIVHIKPVVSLNNGNKRILSDRELTLLKEGRFMNNGKIVDPKSPIEYQEILFGNSTQKIKEYGLLEPKETSVKVAIPVSEVQLDGNFEKKYDRQKMWETAVNACQNFEERKEVVKALLKWHEPELTGNKLDKIVSEIAKSIPQKNDRKNARKSGNSRLGSLIKWKF